MIPKIIHQIWIGDTPPESVIDAMNSIRNHHKNYDYRFYGNDTLKDFGLSHLLENSIPECYITNIMRFTLLMKYGGWHIDADMFANASLDLLPESDFITSVPYPTSSFRTEGGGTLGVIKGFDFSSLIKNYTPDHPMTPEVNKWYEDNNLNPHLIPYDEVGIGGSILHDIRLSSWFHHENFGKKLSELLT